MTMIWVSLASKKFPIEVPLFLIFFSSLFADSVTTNLVIYRTCYVVLSYNQSDCALLGKDYTDGTTAELEQKVQPYTTNIFTTIAVIQAIFPPALCFFFGPWTDTYGRKPLLLSALGGYAVAYALLLTISAIEFASPWFILLHLIPHCLFGGIPAFVTAVLCHMMDVTSSGHRGLRHCCPGNHTGNVALVYTFFLIPESVENVSTEGKLRGLFNFALVRTALKTTFKKRENYERALVLIIISIMLVALFISYGNKGVIFLFLRRKFQWTLQTFTLYTSITGATAIAGVFISVFLFLRVLRIRETIVILFSFISAFSGILFQGLSTQEWHIYVAGTMISLSGAISPMARCLLAKLVPVVDSSKVYSLLTALESLAARLGTTAYTNIYNSTLDDSPAAFNFVSCGIYLFEIVLVIVVLIIQRYHHQMAYKDLELESTVTDVTIDSVPCE